MGRGAIWYSSIINIAGEGGDLFVIPKENTDQALKSMFGMAVNFQH